MAEATRGSLADPVHPGAKLGFAYGGLSEGVRRMLDRVAKARSAPTFEARVRVAGCDVTVVASREDALEPVCRVLAPQPDGPAGRACRITLLSLPRPELPRPTWTADFFEERSAEQELARTPQRLHYFPDRHFWQMHDVARGVGVQIVDERFGPPEWEAATPLRNFLSWQLAAPGRALLHAGSLSIAGRGVLIAGAGGAGKSGLTIQGIARGWTSAGDDYVLADADRSRVSPIYDLLKQDRAGLARLGLSSAQLPGATKNWKAKYTFGFSALRHGARPEGHDLHALLLPRVGGTARTTLTPIGAKAAFLRFVPSCVSQVYGARDHAFAVAARLSRRLPAYDLSLGPDPDESADVLMRFAEGLP